MSFFCVCVYVLVCVYACTRARDLCCTRCVLCSIMCHCVRVIPMHKLVRVLIHVYMHGHVHMQLYVPIKSISIHTHTHAYTQTPTDARTHQPTSKFMHVASVGIHDVNHSKRYLPSNHL